MLKHPALYSFGTAIILSILLFAGMETMYPRRPDDMFSGSALIAVLAFPVIWFFGLLIINAVGWWQGISD
ncbi:MAG: hypothetical protein PHP85_14175 [Gallionella sp.]|nr:hypothetical protein [Gallionella sp.]